MPGKLSSVEIFKNVNDEYGTSSSPSLPIQHRMMNIVREIMIAVASITAQDDDSVVKFIGIKTILQVEVKTVMRIILKDDKCSS